MLGPCTAQLGCRPGRLLPQPPGDGWGLSGGTRCVSSALFAVADRQGVFGQRGVSMALAGRPRGWRRSPAHDDCQAYPARWACVCRIRERERHTHVGNRTAACGVGGQHGEGALGRLCTRSGPPGSGRRARWAPGEGTGRRALRGAPRTSRPRAGVCLCVCQPHRPISDFSLSICLSICLSIQLRVHVTHYICPVCPPPAICLSV